MSRSTERLQSWSHPTWWHALLVLPWLVGFVMLARNSALHRAIASRERTTPGIVVDHDPSNHDSYQYSYSVAGRSFRAWEVPHQRDWHLGEHVVVYYDPTAPAVSSLQDFADRSTADAGPIALLSAGILGVIGYVGYHHLRRRRASRIAAAG